MTPEQFIENVKNGVYMSDENQQKAEPIDWQKQLLPSEMGEQDGTKFVYLKGLRRLARIRGIQSERHPIVQCEIWNHPKKGNTPFVQVSYEVTYKDGETYSDCADTHFFNIADERFVIYPTAICSSRAEARCLKKSLGIDMVSKEELGGSKNAQYDFAGQIRPEQVSGIKMMMKKVGIVNTSEVLKEVTDREDVFSLEELDFKEGQAAMKFLNSRVAKAE